MASFPASDSFVSGLEPGGIVIGGGVTTTGLAAITSAGPNNAANGWNRRNLFTWTDSVRIIKGIHQINAGVWVQRLQDNEDTASRQLGQASFTSLTTFLQGKVSSFQVVPTPSELGWRSLLGAWYFEDTIKLLPNLTLQAGIRHEFTTGWNEEAGRAANYITNGPGVPAPCTTYAPQGVQPNAKTPTVEEWRFTVERQLDRNTVLRVAYVGSFGYHGLLSVDPNTIPAQICASTSGCSAGGTPGTATSIVPQGAQYIPVGSRPNRYLGAGFFWYTEGNSSYNALQADVSRRLTRGLEFRANYTWSKNLDMNSALTGAQANNQAQMILDRNDLLRDWGPSALNVTSQASISWIYSLPFGRDRRWSAGLSRIQ